MMMMSGMIFLLPFISVHQDWLREILECVVSITVY
jgi:hypothetical protein